MITIIIGTTNAWLVLLSVRAVLTNGSFLGYCQYGSLLQNVAAVCLLCPDKQEHAVK